MMVSISRYFSEYKHINVLFIILVLKNSAFTTQAYYYLSWQSTEESAQTFVHQTTKWLLELLRIDGAVSSMIITLLGFFKGVLVICNLALLTLETKPHVTYDYTVLLAEARKII